MITTGFGIMFCAVTGMSRKWVMGADGVKRWADNNAPVEKKQERNKQ